MQRLHIIDSHTGGEPTRVVVSGGPDLGPGSVADKQAVFRDRFDHYRSAIVNEPRGSDVLVGALLVEPTDASSAAGVIFFNNVGYLGMCGHGTIGLVETLAFMGKIMPGICRIETSVGAVSVHLADDGHTVAVENVPSYRYKKSVAVEVPGIGVVHGDIAWGGNWFFMIDEHGQPLDIAHVEALTQYCWSVRQALQAKGITGENGQEIDHIELCSPLDPKANASGAHARNFMLCPGKAYDRSPCGTGTSAKLACLAADGLLAEGERWVQAGILGSTFVGTYKRSAQDGVIVPTISGSAVVTGEGELLLNSARDPFCWGIR